MKIAIGSLDPLKLKAVESILGLFYPEADFITLKTESGVSHTPLSNDETIAGARKRAQDSLIISDADLGVGLEGGVTKISDIWFSCVWCIIRDKKEETLGGGIHFQLPDSLIEIILKQEKELGACMDELVNLTMNKQNMGAEGILTKGMIDRKTTFENAVIYALAPRISKSYYLI